MSVICAKCKSPVELHDHNRDHTHHIEWHCPLCGVLIGTLKPHVEVMEMSASDYATWVNFKQAQWKDVLLQRGKIKAR